MWQKTLNTVVIPRVATNIIQRTRLHFPRLDYKTVIPATAGQGVELIERPCVPHVIVVAVVEHAPGLLQHLLPQGGREEGVLGLQGQPGQC